MAETTIPKGLGGLLEMSFRRPRACAPYLSRYTHRVVISNHRLVSFADGTVTFHWRDSATTTNRGRCLYLSMNSCAASVTSAPRTVRAHPKLRIPGQSQTCHHLATLFLTARCGTVKTEQAASTARPSDPWSCSKCGGPMDGRRKTHRLLKSNFVLHRWSRLRHETTFSNSKTCFDPLRTSVSCRGTNLLFQLLRSRTSRSFFATANFRLIQSRVALCGIASAQFGAAPSHH